MWFKTEKHHTEHLLLVELIVFAPLRTLHPGVAPHCHALLPTELSPPAGETYMQLFVDPGLTFSAPHSLPLGTRTPHSSTDDVGAEA